MKRRGERRRIFERRTLRGILGGNNVKPAFIIICVSESGAWGVAVPRFGHGHFSRLSVHTCCCLKVDIVIVSDDIVIKA